MSWTQTGSAQDGGLPLDRPPASSSDRHSRTSGSARRRLRSGNSVSPAGGHTAPPRRVGRRGRRQLLESLSSRDLAVLRSVAQHRFLATRHVEALHFHDHASTLSGARSARRVLRRLHGAGLLQPLERRIGGIRAGSAGYVWTLGSAGWRLLAEVDGAVVAGAHREPSRRLVDHCLAIAQVHVDVVAASRAGLFELASLQLEPASWRRFFGVGGERRLIRPDLAVVTAAGDYEDHWFLEVDLGSEHPPTVVRKCRLYIDYHSSGAEQDRLGVFPRVVWIVPDSRRADALGTALRQARLDPALFRITTADQLGALLAGGAV